MEDTHTPETFYCCPDLTFHAVSSHFIPFLYFCTLVLQQLHVTVPL